MSSQSAPPDDSALSSQTSASSLRQLIYVAPASSIAPDFWEALYSLKLSRLQLDSSPQPITGTLSQYGTSFSRDSFASSAVSMPMQVPGTLFNVNTIEEFKNKNKQELIDEVGTETWRSIVDGSAVSEPLKLYQFVMFTFADLKSYKFYYWFASPALIPAVPFSVLGVSVEAGRSLASNISSSNNLPTSPVFAATTGSQLRVHSLADAWDKRSSSDFLLVVKTSFSSSESLPWHARNVLSLLAYHSNAQSVDVLSLHIDASGNIAQSGSVLFTVQLSAISREKPKIVGWELNERLKPGPRLADLSSVLDTRRLMSQAVDLNLRLMKWRLWPEVNTDKLASTKCLLLGAGTLGCAVARALLGWGVRNITLVDNGRVSYSNPARQCLFNYQDAVGRRYKAEAAAEALQRIFPDVNAVGVVASIPMPGHTVEDPQALQLIHQLIDTHDVIYALTDSREARWLASVICSARNKMLINALGFDTFLVMRHGHGPADEPRSNLRLGCYFCTDITAASNSQRDRTLDQQCTVTRPGLSFMSAGLAVEMMVALLHSPLGIRHPASKLESDDEDSTDPIPHQIRGSLLDFRQIHVSTPAFECCTACSAPIVAKYNEDPDTLLQVSAVNPKALEDISGVTAMIASVRYDDDSFEENDGDDF